MENANINLIPGTLIFNGDSNSRVPVGRSIGIHLKKDRLFSISIVHYKPYS